MEANYYASIGDMIAASMLDAQSRECALREAERDDELAEECASKNPPSAEPR